MFMVFVRIPLQILLLKTGSFELAIVRMSRLMDLSTNSVLYGDVVLPQEAFYTSDNSEMKLVACIFETVRSIAELKLTETELALYQSLVLLWPGEWTMSTLFPPVSFPYCYLIMSNFRITQLHRNRTEINAFFCRAKRCQG